MKILCTLLLAGLVCQAICADTFAQRKAAREAINSGKARAYLTDKDAEIRRYALYTVCKDDPAKELPALKKAVKDSSPLVRYTAVAVLSRLSGKNAEADKMLLALADDPDAKVRNTADRYSWPFHCKNIRLSEDPSWDYEVITLKSIQIPDTNWKFITDPKNKGHHKKYFQPSFKDNKWKKSRCGSWEKVHALDYDGYAWYRIRFTMPPKPECNSAEVRFTAVDESAWVWLNGKYIGSHDIGVAGWNKPFSLDCRKEILWGKENVLAVRVLDRSDDGGIYKPVFIDILK